MRTGGLAGDRKILSLAKEEQEACASLLGRVTPLPRMEWPILQVLWEKRLVPMNPIELIILEGDLSVPFNEMRVLLRFREDKHFESWNGQWHHPGGYLGGGETITEAVSRVAKKETGLSIAEFYSIGGLNFFQCKRDHELCQLFVCILEKGQIIGDPTLKFFKFAELPESLIIQHTFIQAKAEKWLLFLQSLNPNQRANFLNFCEGLDNNSEY